MCMNSVTQSCVTPCDPMDLSLPSSSVHGILQARILEPAAISTPGDLPRDWTDVSCISYMCRWILYHCTTWEVPYIANTTHTHRWIHVGQFRSCCYQTNLTQAQIMYYLTVPQNSCKFLSLRTVPSEVRLSFSNLCFPLLFLCSPNSSKKLSILHTHSSLFHSFTFSFFCLHSPLPSLYEKAGCQHPMGDDEDDFRMRNLLLRFKISGLIIYGITG